VLGASAGAPRVRKALLTLARYHPDEIGHPVRLWRSTRLLRQRLRHRSLRGSRGLRETVLTITCHSNASTAFAPRVVAAMTRPPATSRPPRHRHSV